MNIEALREYCLQKRGVSESFPFDSETLVFKVLDKAFLLTSLNNPSQINLKCDPERAVELREQYPAIIPGYHMNKKHWNSVLFDGSLSEKFITELIDHSYELVIKGMPRKQQALLQSL